MLSRAQIRQAAGFSSGLTPPFATYNFIAAGLSGESFGSVTKQSLPFLALGYVIILIMCIFPGTYMWLPNLVG